SFEPGEAAYNVLREKYKNTAVKLRQCALGSKEEERSFYVYEYGSVLNSFLAMDSTPVNRFAGYPLSSNTLVQARTLDSERREVGDPHIDLLKVDAQGFDMEVLRGCGGTFLSGAVDNVLVEMIFVPMYVGQPAPAEIMTFLAGQHLHLVGLYEIVR